MPSFNIDENIIINRDYSDIFSIKESAMNNLGPKYFEDIDLSGLNVGELGFVLEQIGNITEDAFNTASILVNEVFPNKAVIPESIYSHAAIFQIDNTFTSCGRCSFIMLLEQKEILKFGKVNGNKTQFYLDKNMVITVKDIPFTLDYDILIEAQKKQLNGSKTDYNFTAKYYMDSSNSISEINDPYLKIRKAGNGLLLLQFNAHQVERTELIENIINNTKINSPVLEFEFENQLAGFDIFYKAPTDKNYTQLEKRVKFSLPIKRPFCYYKLKDENVIEITFTTNERYFQPEFNSEIKMVLYTTLGKEGNFQTYTGTEITVQPNGEVYQYNETLSIAVKTVSDCSNGGEKLSLEGLQALTVESYSSATELSTEADIMRYFYNFKYRHGAEILVIKRRDDLCERLFSAFLILKKDEYIYPTNTLYIDITDGEYDVAANNNTYTLKPGHTFAYKNDSRNTVKVLPGIMSYEKTQIDHLLTDRWETQDKWITNDLWRNIHDNSFYLNDGDGYNHYDKIGNIIKTGKISYEAFEKLKEEGSIYEDIFYIIKDEEYYHMYSEDNVLLRDDINENYFRKMLTIYRLKNTKTYYIKVSEPEDGYQQYDYMGTPIGGVISILAFDEIISSGTVSFKEKYDFLFTNPFLISVTKRPNLVALYKTIQNTTSSLEFVSYNDDTFTQFITSKINLVRRLGYKPQYELSLSIIPSSDIDPYVTNLNTNKGNDVRIVAGFMDATGDEVAYIELLPTKINEEDETMITFSALIETDDSITTSKQVRLLNCIKNKYKPKDTLVPISDSKVNIYIMYDDALSTNNKFQVYFEDMEYFVITNVYSNKMEPLSFLEPMNLMRSTVTFGNIGTVDNPLIRTNLSLIPMVKADSVNDQENFDLFVERFTNTYKHLEDCLDVLRNNTHIDIKFYNTYGKSNNYYIGDNEELIDRVNLNIKFNITILDGVDEQQVITELKDFIKDFIEKINSSGNNDLYISNLIRAIETNFPAIHHLKFTGINDYNTDYQSISVRETDLNNLTKEERLMYVPEILVVDRDMIDLSITINKASY